MQTNDTQVPALVVFVDGRAFHASTQHNRAGERRRTTGVAPGEWPRHAAGGATDLGEYATWA